MRTSLKFRFGKAFTLIELLIVITIIGILAVALVPRISQGPARARDVARQADLKNVATALELYFADNNKYPTVSTNDTGCVAALSTELLPYLQGGTMPTDSSNVTASCTNDYLYIPNNYSSPTGYLLAANLETGTASGDNIYCDVSLVSWNATTNAWDGMTTTDASPCGAGDTPFYVISVQ